MGDEVNLPLFRKKKTFWQIKELEGYLSKLNSQIPPDYEVTTMSLDHQALDEIIRPNWEYLHSLEQDFIFSWFMEYQTAQEKKKKLQKELEEINKEMADTQHNSESKIDELNGQLQMLSSEILNLKNELIQKNQLVEDLSSAIQDKQLSRKELQEKLEQRIQDMKKEMILQQKEFETSQMEIGKQFEKKVMELDEEKLLLNETIEKNKEQISKLEKENMELKKKHHLLTNFREKIIKLQSIISEIPPELLTREDG